MESLAVLFVRAFENKSPEYWSLRDRVYALKASKDPDANDVYRAILDSSYEAWRSLWVSRGEKFTQIFGF